MQKKKSPTTKRKRIIDPGDNLIRLVYRRKTVEISTFQLHSVATIIPVYNNLLTPENAQLTSPLWGIRGTKRQFLVRSDTRTADLVFKLKPALPCGGAAGSFHLRNFKKITCFVEFMVSLVLFFWFVWFLFES